AGEARVLGQDVRSGYRRIRERVGVLPQDFEPFDRLRPREAVAYWASLFDHDVSEEAVASILETVGLLGRADTFALNLSGGEKRRLGIAMALVGQPDLLFLDEPTTGLDPGARRELWTLIGDLKRKGRTILLTTHYLDEAEQLADDVAIMHHGKFVAHGSPSALISQFGGGTSVGWENVCSPDESNPRGRHGVRSTVPSLPRRGVLCPRLPRHPNPAVRGDLQLVGIPSGLTCHPRHGSHGRLPGIRPGVEQYDLDHVPSDSTDRELPGVHAGAFDQRRAPHSKRLPGDDRAGRIAKPERPGQRPARGGPDPILFRHRVLGGGRGRDWFEPENRQRHRRGL